MYMPVFLCVSGEEAQLGLDLGAVFLRLWLLLAEHQGKDEVDIPKYGGVLQAEAVRDLYAETGFSASYL